MKATSLSRRNFRLHEVNSQSWQVIPPLEASGHVQMALDEQLLEQHCRGLCPSTLRFYTWSPPAISLGYHQRHIPDHWQGLVWQGQPVDLVRRPTGGRAVLHQGDLTYAVVTSGVTGDRSTVYRYLCQFLIQGWRSLGVTLHYGDAKRSYRHDPHCFTTATSADLVTDTGIKLIGSAQLQRGHAVLQHGSIRLAPDPALVEYIFGTPSSNSLHQLLQNTDLAPLCNDLHRLRSQVVNALTIAAASCFW